VAVSRRNGNIYQCEQLKANISPRYSISPEARKEILKKLLELNHKIHAEEGAAGLWEKEGKKKVKASVIKEEKTTFKTLGNYSKNKMLM
jgi:hypothetical protein